MKYSISKILLIAFSGIFLWECTSSKKMTSLEPSDISAMVEAHQFHFIAEKMNPLRGPQRLLNSYYDLLISKDTLKSFLPYFGRAFIAPIDPTQGGLRFTSYKFSYDYSQNKKAWDVTIVPKDVTQITKLYFTIFDNGTATLQVNSINLDPISFQGHLEKVE